MSKVCNLEGLMNLSKEELITVLERDFSDEKVLKALVGLCVFRLNVQRELIDALKEVNISYMEDLDMIKGLLLGNSE